MPSSLLALIVATTLSPAPEMGQEAFSLASALPPYSSVDCGLPSSALVDQWPPVRNVAGMWNAEYLRRVRPTR